MALIEREKVNPDFTWKLTDIYLNEEAFEKDYKIAEEAVKKIYAFKETFTNSENSLREALDFYYDTSLLVEKLYIYSMLQKSGDNGDPNYQTLEGRTQNLYVSFSSASSFIEPLILSSGKLDGFIKSDILKPYRRVLKEIKRGQSHTLSESEEKILSDLSDVSGSSKNTFEMLESVDMTFPSVTVNGEDTELSHAQYGVLIKSENREVRKEAFEKYFSEFNKYINTFAATYSGSVKFDSFYAKTRKFGSSLESALFSSNVPVSVYDNLISSVRNALPLMEKYIELRKKALNISDIKTYDLYCPMVEDCDLKLSYEESKELVLKAMEPLGKRYNELLRKAFNERWIDIYENKGKTTGAYSCGLYSVHPFVLLNYTNTLDDAFTVAHELGHAMHSYLSDEAQNYQDSDYKIMAAEVASTVNEVLLTKYLLKTEKDPKRKAYILNHFLEGFRTTVFRQTLFAEFEKISHEMCEKGIPLTAKELSNVYKKLNEEYYKGVEIPELYSIEWARIPHFYNAFYVYQYATGFSAAVKIANDIEEMGNSEKYIEFLKTGGSDYPIEELKIAGVDLSSPETVENAMEMFKTSVEELSELI